MRNVLRSVAIVWPLVILLMGSSPSSANFLLELKAEDRYQAIELLSRRGYDVVGYNSVTGMIEVVTEKPDQVKSYVAKLARERIAAITVESATATESYRDYARLVDFPVSNESYLDTDQTYAEMAKLAADHPEWADLVDLNDWLGLPKTVEGRSVLALRVSANPKAVENEPKLLFVGEHHARELMTHQAVLDTAKLYLERIAAGDATYRQWAEQTAVWFVPVVNPDGLHYVFNGDRMWRKNRSNNGDGSRGVDLNRNYSFKWGECGVNSDEGESQVYKGPEPLSEVEVNVMDRLNEKLKLQFAVSYHSAGDEVLYPYLCGEMAEAPVYYSLAEKLANTLGFGRRLASSSGEDFEHHYARYGTIAFLLEVGPTFQPAFSYYRNTVWPNLAQVLPFMMKELVQPYLEIRVVDHATGRPIENAKINLAEIAFKEGETRATDQFGVYRWRLLPADYSVAVEAEGYRPAVKSAALEKNGTTVTIELEAVDSAD